jgi:hypothetical protein
MRGRRLARRPGGFAKICRLARVEEEDERQGRQGRQKLEVRSFQDTPVARPFHPRWRSRRPGGSFIGDRPISMGVRCCVSSPLDDRMRAADYSAIGKSLIERATEANR